LLLLFAFATVSAWDELSLDAHGRHQIWVVHLLPLHQGFCHALRIVNLATAAAGQVEPDRHGYSSAKGPSMLRQLVQLVAYKLRNRKRFALVHYEDFVRIRTALQRTWGDNATGKTILEIGCGQWRANVALFSALGHRVIAVDPELPPMTVREYAAIARQHGLQRVAKTWILEAALRPRFLRELERLLGQPLRGPSPRLLRTGGETIPLPDDSVDAVVSNNVFEHIADVAAVTKEIRRVLRPGGIAHIIIHPFTAFSGGHHLATIAHAGLQRGGLTVPPWDHLRQNRFPSGVYLNRMRLAEYRAIFEQHLDTIEWSLRGPEGESYLTPEIEHELAQFTRTELLTGKIDYTGQKPNRTIPHSTPATQTATELPAPAASV
jgi:SAM-dependent methyltransferase